MLFKNKYEKDLDSIAERIQMNMSNNYKDAAQRAFAEYCQALEAYVGEGKLSDKSKANYEGILDIYKDKLKGYTHKDQKPYWH